MKSLILEPTEFTPDLHFDPEQNVLNIAGFSRPENVIGFYKPVVKWVQDYIEDVVVNNTEFDKALITMGGGARRIVRRWYQRDLWIPKG